MAKVRTGISGKIAYIEGWNICLPVAPDADEGILYVIRRDANITLNGQKAHLGDLFNGDDVVLHGPVTEISRVEATRTNESVSEAARRGFSETQPPGLGTGPGNVTAPPAPNRVKLNKGGPTQANPFHPVNQPPSPPNPEPVVNKPAQSPPKGESEPPDPAGTHDSPKPPTSPAAKDRPHPKGKAKDE